MNNMHIVYIAIYYALLLHNMVSKYSVAISQVFLIFHSTKNHDADFQPIPSQQVGIMPPNLLVFEFHRMCTPTCYVYRMRARAHTHTRTHTCMHVHKTHNYIVVAWDNRSKAIYFRLAFNVINCIPPDCNEWPY